MVLKAVKEANLQVEGRLAALQEEAAPLPSSSEIQVYRIEAQTEKIVETLLARMAVEGRYERGTAEYRQAKEYLQERVRKIVEEKNKNLL